MKVCTYPVERCSFLARVYLSREGVCATGEWVSPRDAVAASMLCLFRRGVDLSRNRRMYLVTGERVSPRDAVAASVFADLDHAFTVCFPCQGVSIS